VIDDVTGETLAFHFPNVDKQPTDLKPRLTSVSGLEKLTGLVFPVPTGHDKTIVAADVWPGGQGEVMEAKKAACKTKR